MPRTNLITGALIVLVGLVVDSPGAWAEQCEQWPGTVRESFPALGSRNVPLDGVVSLVYCPPLPENADQVRILQDLGAADDCDCASGSECLQFDGELHCLQAVAGVTAEIEGDTVTATAPAPFEQLTDYVIEAPQSSEPVLIRFQTGTSLDEAPPQFEGVRELDIAGCGPGFPSNAACPDDENSEGFVVVLDAEAARDEAGRVNLVYEAYQVRDDERLFRGRIRGDGAADVALTVFLPADELTTPEWEQLCFTMSARDPYGHETWPDRVVCDRTPEYSPFGNACAVAAHPVGDAGRWLPFALLLSLLALRRSRKRIHG